ncbi:hypothetical protein BDQ17DRAFT_1393430 [Cyathus striatus]|nr:hypothetical protein BDQ17DRAFT_1393430 [Cyathus striatus]
MSERSQSRGREYTSSGRGGLGNIRQASLSRDARPDGPDDFSNSRGREPVVASSEGKIFSTGRGGAGNIRSPSRDSGTGLGSPSSRGRSANPQQSSIREEEERMREREREVLSKAVERDGVALHSTGRGGLGNITRSLSRDPRDVHEQGRSSRSRSRLGAGGVVYHSTGRGGAGNMVFGESNGDAEELDEAERRRVGAGGEGIHSTGRGGAANLTSVHNPGVEHVLYIPGERESTGRGGVGNIKSRSASRGR